MIMCLCSYVFKWLYVCVVMYLCALVWWYIVSVVVYS